MNEGATNPGDVLVAPAFTADGLTASILKRSDPLTSNLLSFFIDFPKR
jgi:hypothetical protein